VSSCFLMHATMQEFIHGAAIPVYGIAETSFKKKSELGGPGLPAVCNSQRPRSGGCPDRRKFNLAARFVATSPRPESREWLVTTNRRIRLRHRCGSQTRRYHGLLVAALHRPWAARSLSRPSTRSSTTRNGFLSRHASLGQRRCRSQAFCSLRIFTWQARRGVDLRASRCLLENESGCARAKTQRTFSTPSCGEQCPRNELKALVNYRDFHSLTMPATGA